MFTGLAKAQTIQMDFPAFAGKTYDFVIFQGSEVVKVKQDTIPAGGKFELKVPAKYAPYTGMCRWLITNSKEGGGLDMSIPGYGFSVSCPAAKPDNSNIVYKGYNPTSELVRLDAEQQKIIGRYKTMAQAIQLYDKESSIYKVFQEEENTQRKAFDEFSARMKGNSHFAARFLPIVNITRGIPPHLDADYSIVSKDIVHFIASELNMDNLYTSGHWSAVLDTWVQIQTLKTDNDGDFTKAFKELSDRIVDPTKYSDFIKCITQSLTRYGKDKQIDLITPYIVQSGKINDYSGVLAIYQKEIIGKKAPSLVIIPHKENVESGDQKKIIIESKDFAKNNYKKTLLVFYQSGCGLCEGLMEDLKDNYTLLVSKGIRVITVSADKDEQQFTGAASDFPWEDKLFDFEGFEGVNFRNYSVYATPSIFIIDKKGIVKHKVATFKEVLKIL
jgi:thioredoxin-related protein